eukprot:scaffold4011_cov237-Prasinococcus_capsulatus_cf.AAC.2
MAHRQTHRGRGARRQTAAHCCAVPGAAEPLMRARVSGGGGGAGRAPIRPPDAPADRRPRRRRGRA